MIGEQLDLFSDPAAPMLKPRPQRRRRRQPKTTELCLCVDCGTELLPDTPPGSKDWQRYMVHDQVWADAGLPRHRGGWICIPCLEARLHRQLTGSDFPDLPINRPGRDDDTDLLACLKR